jgi:methyl-accepting chemotaxis protein
MARTSHEVKVRLSAEDRASKEIDKAQSSVKGFSDFLSKHFVFTLSEVARAATIAFDTLRQAVTLKAQERALRLQLRGIGQDLDEFIGKLKEVSDNTVSTANLIGSSSRALLLGIPAQEMSALLETARVSAAATGDEVSKAFEDIVTGIARASPMILDNLGFTVKLSEAYGEYAKKLGKTAESLTATEQRQALLNTVLEQGKQRASDFSDALEGMPTTLGQIAAAAENAKTEIGELAVAFAEGATAGNDAGGALQSLVDYLDALEGYARGAGHVFGALVNQWERALEVTAPQIAVIQKLLSVYVAFDQEAKKIAESSEKAADGIEKTGEAADGAEPKIDELTNSFKELQGTQASIIADSDEFHKALEKIGVELEENVNAEMKRNNELLRQADDLYRQGQITRRDFEAIERAVAEANRDATESLREQVDVLTETQDGYTNAADGVGAYSGALDGATESLNAFTQAQHAANAAAEPSSEFGGTLGGGSKLFPGSAKRGGARSRLTWQRLQGTGLRTSSTTARARYSSGARRPSAIGSRWTSARASPTPSTEWLSLLVTTSPAPYGLSTTRLTRSAARKRKPTRG